MRYLAAAWLACSLLVACGDDAAPADGGPYYACGAVLDAGPNRGLIVREDGTCVRCDYGDQEPFGDDTCAARVGPLPEGCRAFCRAEGQSCYQTCEGVCFASGLDAGPGCTPGQHECVPLGGAGLYFCDPTCGETGGCHICAFDDECVGELGSSAHCQRHCGTCCSSDPDAGVPCLCL
jgi:hypothetical protein